MIPDDTAQAVATARRLADRLNRSLATLAPFHPFDGHSVLAADAALPDASDAFLKRYENLVSHLQDQVWRRIVVEEGLRDPAEMSRRDIAEQMERAGLLPDALGFLDAVRIRNRLAHLYPDDPERQARRLNEGYGASALLLDCVSRAEAWLARRRPIPPASP